MFQTLRRFGAMDVPAQRDSLPARPKPKRKAPAVRLQAPRCRVCKKRSMMMTAADCGAKVCIPCSQAHVDGSPRGPGCDECASASRERHRAELETALNGNREFKMTQGGGGGGGGVY